MSARTKPRRLSKAPMVLGGLAVATLMLAVSGACSQHEPGTYQGGGRSFEVPTAEGTSTKPDSGADNFVPDTFKPDSFVLPDTSGGG